MTTLRLSSAPHVLLWATLWFGCGDDGHPKQEDDASIPADSGQSKPVIAHDAGDAATASMLDTSAPYEEPDAEVTLVDAQLPPPDAEPWTPGPKPWAAVPKDKVREVCHLDPAALDAADAILKTPWAVVRYGKLCHQYMGETKARAAWSATKTLSALMVGMVSYETRNLVRNGRKTGPLRDTDRVDHWLDSFTYNANAQLAHVLAMIAHNPSLAYGQREMVYDTVGTTQINTLSPIMNTALAQLGTNLHALVHDKLFQKLGLAHSTWGDDKSEYPMAFGWGTDVFDMAKVGQLMLRGGVWEGERLLEQEWIYKMTHPSFEDANTGYGYLTWLNASAGWTPGLTTGATLPLGPVNPGACAPVAIYKQHPHGLSEATSCLYDFPYGCTQSYDVGVWQAVGLLGQVIQGHPGLDMVVVGMDLTANEMQSQDPFRNLVNPSSKLWDAMKPAVIKADPRFNGDEAAFCAAYGGNNYAPDWVP